jgi:hypothetical protein
VNLHGLKYYERVLKPPRGTYVGNPWPHTVNMDSIRRFFMIRMSFNAYTMVKGEKQGPYSLKKYSQDQAP